MNVLCWNYMGTTAQSFSNLIKNLRYDYSFSFLILVEMHMSGNKANNIIQNLNFDGRYIQEATGQASGIWCK